MGSVIQWAQVSESSLRGPTQCSKSRLGDRFPAESPVLIVEGSRGAPASDTLQALQTPSQATPHGQSFPDRIPHLNFAQETVRIWPHSLPNSTPNSPARDRLLKTDTLPERGQAAQPEEGSG